MGFKRKAGKISRFYSRGHYALIPTSVLKVHPSPS